MLHECMLRGCMLQEGMLRERMLQECMLKECMQQGQVSQAVLSREPGLAIAMTLPVIANAMSSPCHAIAIALSLPSQCHCGPDPQSMDPGASPG